MCEPVGVTGQLVCLTQLHKKQSVVSIVPHGTTQPYFLITLKYSSVMIKPIVVSQEEFKDPVVLNTEYSHVLLPSLRHEKMLALQFPVYCSL